MFLEHEQELSVKLEEFIKLLYGSRLFKDSNIFEYPARFDEPILFAFLGLNGFRFNVIDHTETFSPYKVELFRRYGSKTGVVLQPTDFALSQGYVEEYYPSVEEGLQAWESCEQELFYYVEVK